MNKYSDYIVYVDESGDHSLTKINPEFPIFVLTFCIFLKEEYITQIVPAFQRIKFKYFGHDMVVFHEREIRKAEGSFSFLTDARLRNEFHADLGLWVDGSPFTIVAAVIRKDAFSVKHSVRYDLYHMAVEMGLEGVAEFLLHRESTDQLVNFIFEARGKREDNELELEFRRVCDGKSFNFGITVAGKQVNSTGLQLADLTARPIGRYVINPDQTNRAYQSIEKKLDRDQFTGEVDWRGLKTYPKK